MAPSLYLSSRHVFQRDPEQDQPQSDASWIIAPIIAGTVLLVVILIIVIRRTIRWRQLRSEQVDTRNDPLSPHKGHMRKRRSTELERLCDEEEQRAMIIRKSIAERSSRSSAHSRRHESISSLTSMLSPSANDKSEEDSDDDGEGEPTGNKRVSGGLRDDWKEFEARVQRERSYSGEVHPAIHPVALHPAAALPPPYQDLPLPGRTVTRSRSSSQGSLPNRTEPPLIWGHPATALPASDWSLRNGAAMSGGRGERPKSEIPGIAVYGAE